MTGVNKLMLGEVTFLSKYYHSKKDSRGSAIFRLAVNIDVLISTVIAPKYWEHKGDIPDIDRILLFMGNFFQMDPYQKLLEIYNIETRTKFFPDSSKSMFEAIKEMLQLSNYLCHYNEEIEPSSSFDKIEKILQTTIKSGKRIILNPQILKLIDASPVDFSQTKILNRSTRFNGRCVVCNNEYHESSALVSHIFTQHTNFGGMDNPINVGDLYRFFLKVATSYSLEGIMCKDYSELCLFALRRFKRLKLSDINNDEIQDTVKEIIESEDFYSKGFRMPGAGFSNLRKQ